MPSYFCLKAPGLSWAILVCVSIGSGACSKTDRTAPAVEIPKVPDSQKPAWAKLLSASPGEDLAVLAGLTIGSSEREVTSVSPTLLTRAGWLVDGYGDARVRALLHAETKRVRSLEIYLPGRALNILNELWGPGTEASVNGREEGWFWFHRESRIQIVLTQTAHTSKMMYWPYIELADLLQAPGKKAAARHPASLIGLPIADAKTYFQRRMPRKLRPGFVTWLKPLQYWTRPLSLRVGEKADEVDEVFFKLSTSGNPGLEARVVELLTHGWGTPQRDTEREKQWLKAGVQVRLERMKPGRLRPPFPTLSVTMRRVTEVPSSPTP